MLKHIICTVLLLIPAITQAESSGSDGDLARMIEISNAWIPEAPPVAKVHAGYLVLTNNSTKDIELTSAYSDAYKRVMFHQTVMENDIASMMHVSSVTIPAGSSLVFEPGAMHLMLMGPMRSYKAGDMVALFLCFGEHVHIPVKVEIRKP